MCFEATSGLKVNVEKVHDYSSGRGQPCRFIGGGFRLQGWFFPFILFGPSISCFLQV